MKTDVKGQPGSVRRNIKAEKNQIVKQMKQAVTIAGEGGIAVTVISGVKYIVLTEPTLQEALVNVQKFGQFTASVSPELEHFSKKHQELHQLMASLNYDIRAKEENESDEDYQKYIDIMDRNAMLYAELDAFTFEFSEAMGKTKDRRRKVLESYKKVFEEFPILNDILEGQLKK
jgi:hypothetical protein